MAQGFYKPDYGPGIMGFTAEIMKAMQALKAMKFDLMAQKAKLRWEEREKAKERTHEIKLAQERIKPWMAEEARQYDAMLFKQGQTREMEKAQSKLGGLIEAGAPPQEIEAFAIGRGLDVPPSGKPKKEPTLKPQPTRRARLIEDIKVLQAQYDKTQEPVLNEYGERTGIQTKPNMKNRADQIQRKMDRILEELYKFEKRKTPGLSRMEHMRRLSTLLPEFDNLFTPSDRIKVDY